jgi:hypothetical protein
MPSGDLIDSVLEDLAVAVGASNFVTLVDHDARTARLTILNSKPESAEGVPPDIGSPPTAATGRDRGPAWDPAADLESLTDEAIAAAKARYRDTPESVRANRPAFPTEPGEESLTYADMDRIKASIREAAASRIADPWRTVAPFDNPDEAVYQSDLQLQKDRYNDWKESGSPTNRIARLHPDDPELTTEVLDQVKRDYREREDPDPFSYYTRDVGLGLTAAEIDAAIEAYRQGSDGQSEPEPRD